jgi:predicted phosphoribosyltransferase
MMDKNTTAKKIVITLPVASSVTIEKLKQESDELEILTTSSNFKSVERFNQDFSPMSDS